MIRALRFLGLLMIHAVVAIIGSAIAEGAIWKIVPAHSFVGVVWKEFVFSIICATSIGFGMWRTWRTSVAKWVWGPPGMWFLFGFLMRRGDVWGGLFGQSSVFEAPNMANFYAFTVPLFRAIFYSVGAYISSLLFPAPAGR